MAHECTKRIVEVLLCFLLTMVQPREGMPTAAEWAPTDPNAAWMTSWASYDKTIYEQTRQPEKNGINRSTSYTWWGGKGRQGASQQPHGAAAGLCTAASRNCTVIGTEAAACDSVMSAVVQSAALQ